MARLSLREGRLCRNRLRRSVAVSKTRRNESRPLDGDERASERASRSWILERAGASPRKQRARSLARSHVLAFTVTSTRRRDTCVRARARVSASPRITQKNTGQPASNWKKPSNVLYPGKKCLVKKTIVSGTGGQFALSNTCALRHLKFRIVIPARHIIITPLR